MKKIVIESTEIEVQSLTPYVYDSGRGEKVLRITVDETTASFDTLKTVLNGNEEPIQYFEDDALKCEYSGYDKFTAQYKAGTYHIEMHSSSVETQMALLMASNERISAVNATLAGVVADLQMENAALKEQMEDIDISGGGGGASWDDMAAAIKEGVNSL